MKKVLAIKFVIEKILKESDVHDLKHVEIEDLEYKLLFKGDNRQLLIFQLIRNHLVSNYEDVVFIGAHKIICNNTSVTWLSETNETVVE